MCVNYLSRDDFKIFVKTVRITSEKYSIMEKCG